MRIQNISNQNFESRKLRLPIKQLDFSNPELMQYGRAVKNVNIIKEYSNPKAIEFYDNAMRENDIMKKTRIFSEMGDFELIDFGDGVLGKIRMNIYLAITKITDMFS